jgi:hypothetical protein
MLFYVKQMQIARLFFYTSFPGSKLIAVLSTVQVRVSAVLLLDLKTVRNLKNIFLNGSVDITFNQIS